MEIQEHFNKLARILRISYSKTGNVRLERRGGASIIPKKDAILKRLEFLVLQVLWKE